MNLRKKLGDLREELRQIHFVMPLLPCIIIEGIRLWIEPPRCPRMTVDHDYEARRERERREAEKRDAGRPWSEFAVRPDEPAGRPPPLKCIHLKERYRRDGHDCEAEHTVAIDLETRQLDWGCTDAGLFNREHQGSGMIGVALISLPFLIPIAPILLLVRRYYMWQEKRHGMSRHGLALLRRLKGQLDPATKALLVEALKNTWKHDQEMTRQVTLDEARLILMGCDLVEDRCETEVDRVEMRCLHWSDETGHVIAHGAYLGQGEQSTVEILGSFFEGQEADELTHCFRNRRLIEDDDGEKDA